MNKVSLGSRISGRKREVSRRKYCDLGDGKTENAREGIETNARFSATDIPSIDLPPFLIAWFVG